MGDKHLDTIPATESDEFIKFCVENLVPNPSESEGENGCDVPAGFTTFSNVLFNDDYDSDSNDDQSLSDEDVREKIYSNPLFDEEIIPMEIDQHSLNAEFDLIESLPNHDSSVTISSKIDSLFDEFAGELTLLKSFPPRIDETDCHPEKEIRLTKRLLHDNSSPRPPKEIVSDNSNDDIESFSPSLIPNKDSDPLMEEIDLYFNPNDPMPPGIEEDDDDSERDIPILEELLDNYSLSLPTNESYHFDIPSPYRPPAKPSYSNTGTLNIKMLGGVSDQKVPIPNLTITRILNHEKSPDLFSHLGFEAFPPSAECPMILNGKNTLVLDSLHNEDISEEIFSNPLFEEEINSMRIGQHYFNAKSDLVESLLNHDSSIIPSSSKIDSLLDEFAGELTLLKSIPPGIDETDYHPENEIRLFQRLLYDNSSPRPPEEFVSENSNADVEFFSPFPIRIEDSNSFMEEIDLTFTSDDPMPSSIEEDDDDSRDILIRKELLDNYSLSLPENESFHFD
nr:hypothetical protein [Tanacetum cinerariifolium]